MNEKNMVSRSVYVDRNIWDEASWKCERPNIQRSISQIVNRLLELWIDGEVVPYPENEVKDDPS